VRGGGFLALQVTRLVSLRTVCLPARMGQARGDPPRSRSGPCWRRPAKCGGSAVPPAPPGRQGQLRPASRIRRCYPDAFAGPPAGRGVRVTMGSPFSRPRPMTAAILVLDVGVHGGLAQPGLLGRGHGGGRCRADGRGGNAQSDGRSHHRKVGQVYSLPNCPGASPSTTAETRKNSVIDNLVPTTLADHDQGPWSADPGGSAVRPACRRRTW